MSLQNGDQEEIMNYPEADQETSRWAQNEDSDTNLQGKKTTTFMDLNGAL